MENERKNTEIVERIEAARRKAQEWEAAITARGLESALAEVEVEPGSWCRHVLAGRAWELVAADAELAGDLAALVLLLGEHETAPRPSDLETTADAMTTLASLQRRRGELEGAADLLRAVRDLLGPSGRSDPRAEAQLLEEEAELEAARGQRHRALAKGRAALRLVSAPWAAPELRTELLRKLTRWARARER